jgi:hypothetical protein
MKIWIEFSQETTMRIPIREASKVRFSLTCMSYALNEGEQDFLIP